jgi:4'-phosphopantetheinyl transferase
VAVERDDGLEVVVTSLALEPVSVRACASLLSGAERERAGRFAFGRDARRYIVGRARLRELLGARLDVPPGSVALATGAQGKPALADRADGGDLRFNLAHSDEVAVYAFSFGREVGIDVEAVRTLRDTDALAAHWFSRSENEAYQALDPRQKLVGFFNCWTRKEAFVKALGEGLSRPLDSFDVSLAPGAPAALLRVEARPGDDRRWQMESFVPAPGFVAAVVAEVP